MHLLQNKKYKNLFLICLLLACGMVGIVLFQNYTQDAFAHFIAQKDREGNEQHATGDLDNDGIEEMYVLTHGILQVSQQNVVVWTSPREWWVDSFVLADANNDGIVDLNCSVWKVGSFGPSHPFWITDEDESIKNHFFIFDIVHGIIKPVWQSSNLTVPNCAFDIVDVNADGKNDLVVVEGEYEKDVICKGNYLAWWKWNGWGFSNEWRSEIGSFQDGDLKMVHEFIDRELNESDEL